MRGFRAAGTRQVREPRRRRRRTRPLKAVLYIYIERERYIHMFRCIHFVNHICIYIYIHMYVCMYIYIWMFTYIYIYMYTYMCIIKLTILQYLCSCYSIQYYSMYYYLSPRRPRVREGEW